MYWWNQGWHGAQAELFTQANLALPNLSSYKRSFRDVFEAFALQHDRINDLQQQIELASWQERVNKYK